MGDERLPLNLVLIAIAAFILWSIFIDRNILGLVAILLLVALYLEIRRNRKRGIEVRL